MENIVRVALLLDFYGNLLTDRQRQLLRLHYEDDLSLGEISEQIGVTRAAVHDSVRRGMALLEEYESKLGLIKRREEQAEKIKQMRALLTKALEIAEALEI